MKVLPWIELHPGLAAWLQAGGSLLAIGLAIWVPYWQRNRVRKDAESERMLKARSIVMLVSPELLLTHVEIENATQLLAGRLPSGMPPTTVLTPFYVTSNINITVPQMLRERADNLYLLGDPAGHTLQQLLAVIIQWQETLVGDAQTKVVQNPNITLAEVQGWFAGHLKLIAHLLDQLDEELKPFDIKADTEVVTSR